MTDPVADDRTAFHGLEMPLRCVGGAKSARVVHGHGQVIAAHQHDWACITIPVLGRATEKWHGGEARLRGPCVVAHPPKVDHSDEIGVEGLETVSIQFDPKWLSRFGFEFNPAKSLWRAGLTGTQQLVHLWSRPATGEADLAKATAIFLKKVIEVEPAPLPAWLKQVQRRIDAGQRIGTASIAAQLGLNAAWLARAYRASVGEGLEETARRQRVERAVELLRRTDLALADIAAASGFCDQSHMNRNVKAVLDRTPLQIRSERPLLQNLGGRSLPG